MSTEKTTHTPKQSYNRAGDGWTYLTQLNAPHSSEAGEGRAVPEVRLQEKLAHAGVIRLSFRKGDVMDDHHAPGPILVLGQEGQVDFTIGAETLRLEPGTAISVDEGITHSLRSVGGPAVVTLVLLPGSATAVPTGPVMEDGSNPVQ
ncbi:cupin domain-containing protein [Corynebacterium sp.]|uniref:cupin domain-containing protein n=1 Tax=Corynebacterium sp. TaxID=1720 RepID=UPI0026DB6AF8|nr:cupin domain-containing protein [Corynebacterium sp.]MDO5032067.1 cupin domain-containing protein [Corynebacterium sp.]